ncbi:MAG TPA: TIM barrel protein [Verrucomicrobiae bacterium]|jgi:sugar phosphate isomerase/epimerase|nr:TIM barrel protein [Verrucomicrobiae bacterium]
MSREFYSRREFVRASAVSSATLALTMQSSRLASGADDDNRGELSTLICFIKPFQNLPFDQIADTVAEVGWAGAEIPVRQDGTIQPARVEEDLPRLAEALAKRKIEFTIIATDAEDADDALTQKVLQTAAKAGIRRYRTKHLRYDLKKPIPPQLENFRAKIRGLAALNKELHLQGTIQNHSGNNYLGAPVWDIWEIIRDLDPKHMAMYFDIGHATLEGGLSWPLQVKLMESYFATVSVKDFTWNKSQKSAHRWQADWCPLGEGMVQPEFFKSLKQSGFLGPLSQHFEYPVSSGQEMISAMKKDVATLKRWLAV